MKDGMLNSQQKHLVDLRWDITLKVIPQILYSSPHNLNYPVKNALRNCRFL